MKKPPGAWRTGGLLRGADVPQAGSGSTSACAAWSQANRIGCAFVLTCLTGERIERIRSELDSLLRTRRMWDDALDPVAGLTVTVTAVNLGAAPAPFGAGFHPYLDLADHDLASAELLIPAGTVLRTDERQLPVCAQRTNACCSMHPSLRRSTGLRVPRRC